MKYFTRNNILLAAGLIAFGVISKLAIIHYHNDNVETFTAAITLAGALLGPYLGAVVGLGTVIGKDIVLGNTNILIYTWSAWAIIGAASAWLKVQRPGLKVWSKTAQLTGWSLVTTGFFYAWTNFGVWHIGGLYPHSLAGLVECYVNALPFLRNQLLGNMIFVPVLSVVVLSIMKYVTVASPTTVSSKSIVL